MNWNPQQIIDDFRESEEWKPMGFTPRSDFVKITQVVWYKEATL